MDRLYIQQAKSEQSNRSGRAVIATGASAWQTTCLSGSQIQLRKINSDLSLKSSDGSPENEGIEFRPAITN